MTFDQTAASPQLLDSSGATESAAIEVAGLSFLYGSRVALEDLSFSIIRGEMCAVLGPNGSGKTTLFKLLSTLTPLQSGRIAILGHDLSASDTRAVRRRMGVVFQHPSLDIKLTVAENLAHHGRLYGLTGRALKQRIREMLDRFGLEGRSADLVETLSGGLRRRVELAKALIHRPELMLLDEPSTGLDPIARTELLDYLSELQQREGVTVVLTTHYLEEAERCGRVAILDGGQLVALGRPGELKARIGREVIVLQTESPERLKARLLERLGISAKVVGPTVRIECQSARDLLERIMDAFGSELYSVTLGKPTLEDVFIHLTGHRFHSERDNAISGE